MQILPPPDVGSHWVLRMEPYVCAVSRSSSPISILSMFSIAPMTRCDFSRPRPVSNFFRPQLLESRFEWQASDPSLWRHVSNGKGLDLEQVGAIST